MKRRKTNIKPMFLLVLLAVFSFFVINKTEGIDWEGKKQKMYESKPAECTTCKTGEGIKEIIDNDSSINYVLLQLPIQEYLQADNLKTHRYLLVLSLRLVHFLIVLR